MLHVTIAHITCWLICPRHPHQRLLLALHPSVTLVVLHYLHPWSLPSSSWSLALTPEKNYRRLTSYEKIRRTTCLVKVCAPIPFYSLSLIFFFLVSLLHLFIFILDCIYRKQEVYKLTSLFFLPYLSRVYSPRMRSRLFAYNVDLSRLWCLSSVGYIFRFLNMETKLFELCTWTWWLTTIKSPHDWLSSYCTGYPHQIIYTPCHCHTLNHPQPNTWSHLWSLLSHIKSLNRTLSVPHDNYNQHT